MRRTDRAAVAPGQLAIALAVIASSLACGELSNTGSPPDSGLYDAGADAGAPDAGVPDAGVPDFAVAVQPPSGITPGAGGEATVSVTRLHGQSAAIGVTLEGNALGITGSGTIPAGASSGTLTLSVPATASFGAHQLRANASDGVLTRGAAFSLSVTPSTINGTVDGSPFAARDAVSVTAAPKDGCPMHALVLTVSNAAGSCSRAADACLGQRDLLEVQLAIIDTKAIGAGTYEVIAPDPSQPPPAGKFVGMLSRTNASCQGTSAETLPRAGPGSSATIASVSEGVVSGRLDLAFSDGGGVSGPFTAIRCAALAPANGFCAPPTAPICNGTRTCQ